MFNLLVDSVVKFGISSLFGNIGTTMITKSGNKFINKVGIGLGTLLINEMVCSSASKFIKDKIGLDEKEEPEVKEIAKEPEVKLDPSKEAADQTEFVNAFINTLDAIEEDHKKKSTKRSTKKKGVKTDGGEISE